MFAKKWLRMLQSENCYSVIDLHTAAIVLLNLSELAAIPSGHVIHSVSWMINGKKTSIFKTPLSFLFTRLDWISPQLLSSKQPSSSCWRRARLSGLQTGSLWSLVLEWCRSYEGIEEVQPTCQWCIWCCHAHWDPSGLCRAAGETQPVKN